MIDSPLVTVLAGGVGAARFLAGLVRVHPPSQVYVIGNTGDDTVLHGLHISPDLDTVVYTLAGEINRATGWGLTGETWAAMTALQRYGGQTWFRLGDRDLGTHLYRTSRLDEGADLAAVTDEIAKAWDIGVRLVPVTTDRLRTMVTVAGAGEIGFQEYFVERRHDVVVESVRFDGAEVARPTDGVLDAIAAASVVVVAPSNPIVSIGPILAVPGVREAVSSRRDVTVAVSPIVGRCRAEGTGRPAAAGARPRGFGRRRGPSLRTARRHPCHRRGRRRPRLGGRGGRRPLRGRSDDHVGRGGGGAPGSGGPRGRPAGLMTITLIPVEGMPEVRPGDDLAGLIVANGELRDGDVIVVTQKVVSKAEGRLVPHDADDPEAKRRLIESESVRILRRRGGMAIVETRHGFVCANAGIDLSNVEDGWAALLPEDSDRSARRLRDGVRARAGVDVAVIISDTFGRAWRRGLVDVAIGCAGIGALLDLRGTVDSMGRELNVTQVAVVDELAAAAELVMGKSSGVAAAIVRGVDAEWLRPGEVRGELVRPPAEDMFR